MKNIEKYIIKKGKEDLLSSLKAINNDLIKKALKYYHVDTLEELKKEIIDEFELTLDMAKDDIFTRIYFERLLDHENSVWLSAYQQDIEHFLAFVYENGDCLSYYIPTEIKAIIIKLLEL